MEVSVGAAVELMGVENAGLDITGTRGTVTQIAHGLVSVAVDGSGEVVSAWPENLKILSSTPVARERNSSAVKRNCSEEGREWSTETLGEKREAEKCN